jgi:hypothetical protein
VIADVLGVLNGRDRRLAEDVTLAELASEFGVSRVRQIEVRVFKKVQKAVKNGSPRLGRPYTSRCMSFRASPVGGRNCRWTVVMGAF